MVDLSVAMSIEPGYLVPIHEACDPTVPHLWRNPVSDLIGVKWRNSLGMCLLSGYHLVIWERIYLTELGGGCGCYVFPVFGNDALVEVDVYIHTELFIIFRAMVSTPPKKHTQFTLGLYFGYLWMSNTKELCKLGIPHRFRDEVWWSGRWTVIWKESNSSFYNPADIFCASPPSFPTFMSHHLPQFKNRTSSAPSLWDAKWPGYLHHFPLLCYVPWRHDTPAKQTRDPGMNQSASHLNRGPKPLSPVKNESYSTQHGNKTLF